MVQILYHFAPTFYS